MHMIMWQILATIGLIGFALSEFIYIEEKAQTTNHPVGHRVYRYTAAVINLVMLLVFIWVK